jgi:diguanylate cyclase (GGDEF)-like protein
MSNKIKDVLACDQIHTLFHPILPVASGEPFGLEALSRGPAGSDLHSPLQLFAAATEAGVLQELERACIASAIRHFAALESDRRLFINVLPDTLLSWPGFVTWFGEQLDSRGVDPHNVIVEITEHGGISHETDLARAIRPLRRLGCDVAIDDLGAGSSGLKTWSEIRPEFVKVDRYFVAGIERDPVRAEILRAVVDMARATGSHVVAEGIENPEQHSLVVELGVDYVQGYLFGKPQSVPRVDKTALALELAAPPIVADCAEHIALQIPPVPADASVMNVVEIFRQHPQWRALAVVDETRPLGLVRRDDLLIRLSRPLQPELFNRKPVAAVMDEEAVLIDARTRLDQVSRLVTGQLEARHQDDFIITRASDYLGLGRTIDLLRHITAQQIQAAKQSNPLTGLPGNREIQTQLGQLINRRRSFLACHIDLDNFKAFNDTYGYQCGDQVLMHVAATLTRHLRPRVDFVGHIGGDDFVVLMRSQDWSLRLMSLIEDLAVSLVSFHSAEHRAAGFIKAQGRDGNLTEFPLLSVSVAAVEVAAGPGVTAESIAEDLRRTKAAAKSRPGCSCMLSSGTRLIDLISNPANAASLALDETTTLIALQ